MGRPTKGYHLNGEPVPGTTTICGMLNKPALVGWAGKLCTDVAWKAGRAGDDMPRWTDICYGTRDDAAAAGTLVHDLLDAYVRGNELPSIPVTAVGEAAQRGFANARQWIDGNAMKLIPHERPLVSAEYRYGGTPDLTMVNAQGVVYLGDYKTSAGVYPEMIIQMAAYRQLLQEVEGIEVAGLHLIRFSREHGDFAHHGFSSDIMDTGWNIFRSLLSINAPLKALEKRVH